MRFVNIVPLAGLLLFIVLLSGRIYFLRKQNVQVTSRAPNKNKQSDTLFLVFILLFILWIFEMAKPAFHFSISLLPEFLTHFLFNSFFLKFSGTVFIFTALILMAVTLLHFKTSLRFGLDENNRGKLITTGIFARSRNPFFLSLDFYFLGVAFIFPNLFFIVFTFLAVLSIHFFILKEEKFLRKMYGNEYEKYTKKVRRYF